MATLANTLRGTELNIKVIQGDKLDSNNATFTVVDDDGSAINLTGYTSADFKIMSRDFTEVLTIDEASGITLANGSFVIARSAAQMAAISVGVYYYRLKLDEEITILYGLFIVTQ